MNRCLGLLILLFIETDCKRTTAFEAGMASWYGERHHGRLTASGERFDMNQLTAAHKTLPFGARVKVHDVSTGRDVEVRINDRGPFAKSRILDLAKAAAGQLDLIARGTTKVELHVLSRPRADTELFGVQVGMFDDEARAQALRDDFAQRFTPVRLVSYAGLQWRVIVGEEPAIAGAEALATRIGASDDIFVVRIDEE